MTTDLRQRLLAGLQKAGPPSSDYDLDPEWQATGGRPLRAAGVLVAVVDRPEGATLVLTMRASTLEHHPGQIAFPGGKVDKGDHDVVAAALREAEEEVGLPRSSAEVLGTCPPHHTVTGFIATPVLALVQPFEPVPEAGEVAEVFEVPLAHVLDRSRYSVQTRYWRGMPRDYFTVPYGPYYIWGATARMLRALADRISDAD